MSITTDIGEGFAQILAAEVTGLAWQPTGAYPTNKTGIYIAVVPATPNRIVTLTVYGLGDDAAYADSTKGLQVRSRSAGADPRDVYALDDAIADVLLGRYPITLPTGIQIQTIVRTSSTPLGQDSNQRWEFSANYSLGLYQPGAHRL